MILRTVKNFIRLYSTTPIYAASPISLLVKIDSYFISYTCVPITIYSPVVFCDTIFGTAL